MSGSLRRFYQYADRVERLRGDHTLPSPLYDMCTPLFHPSTPVPLFVHLVDFRDFPCGGAGWTLKADDLSRARLCLARQGRVLYTFHTTDFFIFVFSSFFCEFRVMSGTIQKQNPHPHISHITTLARQSLALHFASFV